MEKINFYDCYPCLNHNIYTGIMFLLKVWEFLSKRSVIIHQKVFEPGYTHLEVDTIHALIKKTWKNTTASVKLISDWVNLIWCILPIINRDGAERVIEFQILGQDRWCMQNDKYRRKNYIMAENKIMRYNPDHPA